MRGLRLGTVNARSMQEKALALSNLVTSMGITVTSPTARETFADLAEMTPQGVSFFQEPGARWRGGSGPVCVIGP